MSKKRFSVNALVDTDNPTAIRPVLEMLAKNGSVAQGSKVGEFVVRAEVYGDSAKDLNRSWLSALRRAEKKTRLHAEWTSEGTTSRFFDYVLKKTVRE
jgi:hypothetical protein